MSGDPRYTSKYWVLKLNETGDQEWQMELGGNEGQRITGLVPLSNGHMLVAGVSRSDVSGNKTTPKIDPDGGDDYWLLELMPCQNASVISKTICHGDTYDFNGTPVNIPGVYKQTLTNQYGCDSVVEMTLGFYPFENPAVTVRENVLSSVETHKSYQWLKDGQPLPGEIKPGYTASQNGLYQLVAGTDDNCRDTSLVVRPVFKPNIFVPNLFSPNGDGKNDVLRLYGNQLLSARLLIFNQWGQKLFETSDATQTGWDGNAGAKPQPAGVYIYVWEATLGNGTKETGKGSFSLVR
jgi:gliding motility-associated-like protein